MCALVISTLHIYKSALSGADGHGAGFPGGRAALCGMCTVMLSQNALLAGSHILWAVFWPSGSASGPKEETTEPGEGEEIVINCQSQGSN